MDTAGNYRILAAEDAVTRLSRRIRQWGMPWPFNRSRALEHLEEVKRSLLKIKYSYLPVDLILESEELKMIVEGARRLKEELLPQTVPRLEAGKALALAEIKYALLILLGLPNRIKLGEQNHPEYAVDIVGVEVTRVARLEGSERLKVTRASAGRAVFTIVTNIQDLRVGEVRAAALLPPAEFMGVVSEAMYSSNPLGREYIGRRVPRRLLSPGVKGKIISLFGK